MKDQLVTQSFWQAASLRAVRTFCQGLLAVGGAGLVGLISAQWWDVILTSLGLALASLLTSVVAGIPEAPRDEDEPQLPAHDDTLP